MKKLVLFFFCTTVWLSSVYSQKSFRLDSPDGRITTHIEIGDKLTYEILHDGQPLLAASPLSVSLTNGEVWGRNARLSGNRSRTVSQTIPSPFYKKAEIEDHYNELRLIFTGQWGVEFRAYNDGVAYRFFSQRKKPFTIQSEEVVYQFTEDVTAHVPYVEVGEDGDYNAQFMSSFENTYTTAPLSALNPERLMFLPLVADVGQGKRLLITESDLESYPGVYLTNAGGNHALTGVMAPYPKETVQGGHNMLQLLVTEREDYIAKVDKPRTFPWRAVVVSTDDKELADSDMTYKLASPSRIADTSWIKPGKVAWEWWNNWNLEGVDFITGINNDTYKYYIDFASAHGIEYVILDEGWAVNLQADLMQVVPEIDLPELVAYGREKNVDLILWAGYHAFNRDMENICRHYADMGIKGFKIDFMDRDDQEMVEFNYRASETCARYKLIVDLHGMYKPAGLNRTYPNVLNFEGVHGLEQMKWRPASVDQMKYDVTIPFIRQVAGPVDYTQGAMRNAAPGNYFPNNSEPMSQGTRCHQLATYIVFESPFNMLCDSPTNYMKEPEALDFITQVPTVWDETITLEGELGEYVLTARRKGENWYVGGLTNWTPREVEVDLFFLPAGNYNATLFKDGVNAHRKGTDYKKESLSLDNGSTLKVYMAPGGGFTLQLHKM